MAIAAAAAGLACRTTLACFRKPLIFCIHKKIYKSSSVVAVASPPVEPVSLPRETRTQLSKTSNRKGLEFEKGCVLDDISSAKGGKLPLRVGPKKAEADYSKAPEWKKLSSGELGIRSSMISKPTRLVLNGLRKKGYAVYLVGGCVRDLILQKAPKDFDIITSAELREVLKTFHRCEVVGRRFPICHVHVDDTIVEVSSFSTSARKSGRYSSHSVRKPPNCDDADFMRWRNCLQRDFTINGLMLDPFEKIVYDYMGGLEDIRRAKVRSVIPAATSFMEDCARILRGVRIAARLGFRFARETAHFMRELSDSVLRLDKGRILLEMNYMMAYGSAEASMRLLWKFGLLEILLPIQASYFVSQGFRRRDKRSNMLLSLFSNLDKLVAPDRPCHTSLWVAILAFHKALADRPWDPLVVAAFSIAVHTGGSLSDAIEIVRKISQPHDTRFSELTIVGYCDSDETLLDEVMNLSSSVKASLGKMTDEHFVSRALIKHPQAPISDLVFIPVALSEKVSAIFECVKRGKEKAFNPKMGSKIDYGSLAVGRLQEVRHLFARIVFDTVYPLNLIKDDTLVVHGNSA